MERERKVLTQEFLRRTFWLLLLLGCFFPGPKEKAQAVVTKHLAFLAQVKSPFFSVIHRVPVIKM
jgi:hypothetical protein